MNKSRYCTKMIERKFLIIGMFVLLFLTFVSAQVPSAAPSEVDPFVLQTIFAPTPPDTGISCSIPNDIRGYSCNGKVLHYEQCQQSTVENTWQPRTMVCEEQCMFSKCRSHSFVYSLYIGIAVVIIIFLILIIYAIKPKRHKRK